MSTTPKFFFVTMLSLFILLSVSYLILTYFQLGSHVKAEWWLKNVYTYKDHLAKNITSPKLIIISGSNSLFGINSETLQNATGHPVINLAGHASLDISYLYFKIQEYINPQDIVVMPLEFEYYRRTTYSDWFVNNMLAWGEMQYFKSLSISNLAKFIFSIKPIRVYNGVVRPKEGNPVLEIENILANLNNSNQVEIQKWRGYHYTSLNKYGDIVSGESLSRLLFQRENNHSTKYINQPIVSANFVEWYSKIQSLISKNNGRLILTWPATIRGDSFDLSKEVFQKKVENLRSRLEANSIKIRCNPSDFNMKVDHFFNTSYHLNKNGAQIRSENLASCIKQIIN